MNNPAKEKTSAGASHGEKCDATPSQLPARNRRELRSPKGPARRDRGSERIRWVGRTLALLVVLCLALAAWVWLQILSILG